MSTKSRYFYSMFLAAIFQLFGMIFLVVFMHDAVHATAKIPATFALGSMYCQIFSMAFYFIADHLNK